MKKIVSISIVFLIVFVFTVYSETSIRVGKTAVSAHLNLGENNDDSIGQLGGTIEYGIINHLSAGIGYVYVDGMNPIQAHGLDLFVKGYLFDKKMDIYGELGAQIYGGDDSGLMSTFITGFEWQSPFKLFIAIEAGAELESSNWGYLYGAVIGIRI